MISDEPERRSGAGDQGPADLEHRYVRANRIRFHLVVGRSFDVHRPLVLLMHGFGRSWQVWRHQLVALDQAGWSVAALDLRGYGDSDKPPGGYQQSVTATDIAGVIAELGYPAAVLVGAGWGGIAAWSTYAYAPDRVGGLAMIAAPHPLRMPLAYRCLLVGSQVPVLPERLLAADSVKGTDWLRRRLSHSELLAQPGLLSTITKPEHSSVDDWPGPQRAFAYLRRFGRDHVLPAGASYRAALRSAVQVPLLTVRSATDRMVSPQAMRPPAGARRWHQHVDIVDASRMNADQGNRELTAILSGWLSRSQPPLNSVVQRPSAPVSDAPDRWNVRQ